MYLSLIVLFVVLGASFFTGRSLWFDSNKAKLFKFIFIFSIILIFIFNAYLSYQQYKTWSQNDEISKRLLPPYQSINYFLFFAFTRFFAPILMSLIVAILFLLAAKILNKKYEQRFFEPEEYYFGALGIFLSSHPGWLFYLIFLIAAYLLIHLYLLFRIHNSSYRISLYYLWIPTAIFVIIINNFLLSHLSYLKFLLI